MDFKVVRNNIANMAVDAVVLPANPQLRVGSGASKAIFDAAGSKQLEKECAKRLKEVKHAGINLEPGMSVATHAYDLPSKVILHTIVPKWLDGHHSEYDELCMAYLASLSLADKMGISSIAFPLLASGNNGFDIDVAIEVAVKSIEHYQPVNDLSEVYLVTFGEHATKKMRDFGYEVEEYIDQRDVRGQAAAQGFIVSHSRKKLNKDVDKLISIATDWLKEPENKKKLMQAAYKVMLVVVSKKLPEYVDVLKVFEPDNG